VPGGAEMCKRLINGAVIALASVLVSLTATATPITFDFENERVTRPSSGAAPGLISTLSMSAGSSLTVDVLRPGTRFDIVRNARPDQVKPAPFGNRSLDPFFDTRNRPFIFNFSKPIERASILMGDYGQDTPDILKIEAFSGKNATGSLLTSDLKKLPTVPPGSRVFNYRELSVSSENPIRSLRINGGTSSFPSSVFYDKLLVELHTPPGQQSLYLDFDNAMSRDFIIKKDASNNIESLVATRGSEPTVSTTSDFRNAVIAETKAIFERSGINIPIVSSPTKNSLIARFAPTIEIDENGDGTRERTARGEAFNVAPHELPFVDRFNLRRDGEVGIFFDPAIDTPAKVATLVAHEFGHGLGAMHVNPFRGNTIEVMDYEYEEGKLERFINSPAEIFDPPTDRNTTGDGRTNNSVFHLRRYAVGDSRSVLESENVIPGTWDTGSLTIYKLLIDGIAYSGLLYDLAVQTIGASQAKFGESSLTTLGKHRRNSPAAGLHGVESACA
jgi:hypothetical protein